ncbi:MAG: hypothetical protein HY926_08905 [Elusimicrobia bacterium]|nr:hypothetical protein [Elusimicrobiota bacterium]
MPRSYISGSSFGRARDFLLLTAAVAVLCGIGFESIFHRLGETLDYGRVLDLQAETGELFGQGYFNAELPYKMLGIRKARPRVLALGSSTIMQLRRADFPPGITFYNAALAASVGGDLDGMLRMLESLSDADKPKTIIIGLDPWLFNPDYPPNRNVRRRRSWVPLWVARFPPRMWWLSEEERMRVRFGAYETLIRDQRPWVGCLLSGSRRPGIGLEAKIKRCGFASDGSYIYPADPAASASRELSAEEWAARLAADRYRFAAGDQLDGLAGQKLARLLEACRNRGIKAIGILPPLRRDFLRSLEALPSHSVFFDRFRRWVPAVFEDGGGKCYDFSRPESLGLTGADFIDENHASSRAWARIVQRMAREL